MARSEVIIPPDLNEQIVAREKVWADFDRSQNLVAELGTLSSAIPSCNPAPLQLPFGADNTPLAELEVVLPQLKENIDAVRRFQAEVSSCNSQIEAIKRREKMIITIAILGGVVLLLVLILVIVNLAS